MRRYAVSDRKFPDAIPTPDGWDIVIVGSDTDPDKAYRVDVTNGRCNCPAWIYQRGGQRYPCKHLSRLGFKYLIQTGDVELKQPSKAKSGQKIKVISHG